MIIISSSSTIIRVIIRKLVIVIIVIMIIIIIIYSWWLIKSQISMNSNDSDHGHHAGLILFPHPPFQGHWAPRRWFPWAHRPAGTLQRVDPRNGKELMYRVPQVPQKDTQRCFHVILYNFILYYIILYHIIVCV